MNWRWTWVNFFASLWINRLSFLRDIGLHHLHEWVTHHQPGSDNYPAARQIDFYVSALLSVLILSLFHLRPLRYGVLLPSMPGVTHILQDGHLVPLVDPPPQSLTRKVFFLWLDIDINTYNVHRSQLTKKALLYLALLVSCTCITYLYVASLIPLYHSTPAWHAVDLAFTTVMFLFVLGILKLFSTFNI